MVVLKVCKAIIANKYAIVNNRMVLLANILMNQRVFSLKMLLPNLTVV